MRVRQRLEYLDGIRGAAAFYVILYHISMLGLAYLQTKPAVSPGFTKILEQIHSVLLNWGHAAVCIFIALSGYCLMLTVVMREDRQLPGGFSSYIKRRARRIMPAYYGALAFSLICATLPYPIPLPASQEHPFSAGSIISHIFLVHNLIPKYVTTINPPMWSVALEWQIYFLLPLVFLPIWRRWGVRTLIIAGLLIGVGLSFLYPGANPQMITIFAMGAAAAAINAGRDSDGNFASSLAKRISWRACAIGLMLLVGVCFTLQRKSFIESSWGRAIHLSDFAFGVWPDIFVGAVTACWFIVWWQSTHANAEQSQKEFGTPATRFFNSKLLINLGSFSYSLYLLHYPIMLAMATLVQRSGMDAKVGYFVYFSSAVLLSLSFAWLFHLLFEKRLVTGTWTGQRSVALPSTAKIMP